MEPAVIAHMEERLGRIRGSVPGSRHAHWTVVFSEVPSRKLSRMPVSYKAKRLVSVWTVGLSFVPLVSPQTHHKLRLELFTLCDPQDRFEAERVMGAVAEAIDTTATPILRGQVIGPLPPEAGVHAVYASMPKMFDTDFPTLLHGYCAWLLGLCSGGKSFWLYYQLRCTHLFSYGPLLLIYFSWMQLMES